MIIDSIRETILDIFNSFALTNQHFSISLNDKNTKLLFNRYSCFTFLIFVIEVGRIFLLQKPTPQKPRPIYYLLMKTLNLKPEYFHDRSIQGSLYLSSIN